MILFIFILHFRQYLCKLCSFVCISNQGSHRCVVNVTPTLFVQGRLLSPAFSFGLSIIRDFTGHGAGHIQLVDVQAGLTEGGHGGVHAGVAIGGAVERSQVQGFAPGDDGDVEGEFAMAVGRGRLGDGERRRRGELAAGVR